MLLAHRDEAARELERLATTDGLTGVLNRRAWLARTSVDLAVGARYRHPVGVLIIDLDHFKRINDTHGHAAGDGALLLFADALRAVARAGDVYCRYGGEEFCVLMNHADGGAVRAFDQRLRAWLGEAAPRLLGYELPYSAGVAMRLSDGEPIEALLQRADSALYSAKAQGRNLTLNAGVSDAAQPSLSIRD
jgi:diguanylate cyclase (GGDEF)-like protein